MIKLNMIKDEGNDSTRPKSFLGRLLMSPSRALDRAADYFHYLNADADRTELGQGPYGPEVIGFVHPYSLFADVGAPGVSRMLRHLAHPVSRVARKKAERPYDWFY